MADALLVIGIHRAELAFGQQVAAGLNPALVAVLAIPEGINGQHPRADQRFHYDTLHRALYLQLLPHVHQGKYTLLMDLHSGLDPQGLNADIFSATPERLAPCLAGTVPLTPQPRLVRLGTHEGDNDSDHAFAAGHTVIPAEVWRHRDFQYVGIEIYLQSNQGGSPSETTYARDLITRLAVMAQ